MDYMNELFKRYLADQCTPEEVRILLRYFELEEHSKKLEQLVKDEFSREEDNMIYLSGKRKATLESVEQALMEAIASEPIESRSRLLYRFVSIAALIIAVLGFVFFIYRHSQPAKSDKIFTASTNNDIEPGTNRAILLLDNGKTIALDESKQEIKTDTNGIKYSDGGSIIENKAVRFVALTIPRKGKYITVLPDGTKVWLNSASSLRYPTQFTANQRIVELDGEGYFEVAHDRSKPFIVTSKGQQVKVLGTRFNISSYDNEPGTLTTLVQGSIELSSNSVKTKVILKPGQQALLTDSGLEIHPVQTATFTSWTENEFSFKGAPLSKVMRQLERWYDIDVEYSSIPQNITVTASLDRNKKLSAILLILERTADVRFVLKGRRLSILK